MNFILIYLTGEISEFNKEFETKLASQVRTSHHHHHRPHLGGNQPFAIEDGSRKKSDRKSKSKSKH